MYYIREFQTENEDEVVQLCQNTILHINSRDYNLEQIKIWISLIDMPEWRASLRKNHTFVAVNQSDNKIIGMAELTDEGCLTKGYIHSDHQGEGIGRSLLQVREGCAIKLKINSLFSEVSITARPFFEKMGYTIEKVQTKTIQGVAFTNYLMKKKLF